MAEKYVLTMSFLQRNKKKEMPAYFEVSGYNQDEINKTWSEFQSLPVKGMKEQICGSILALLRTEETKMWGKSYALNTKETRRMQLISLTGIRVTIKITK